MNNEKETQQDAQRNNNQLYILTEIGKTLTSSLTIKEVLQKIFYKVAEVFNPDNWSLLLVDEEKNELYFEIAVGRAAESIKDLRLKIGEGVAGWVAQNGIPLVIPEVKKDPRFSQRADDKTHFATQSLICIPLRIRDKVMGVIELVNQKLTPPQGPLTLEALYTIADYAAIALENARHFEQIHKLTITDDITSLYNSRHLHTLLQQQVDLYQTSKRKFSIIFLDLDCFKKVNDVHGHLLGSRLLTKIGHLIKKSLKNDQWAARYGGDEFAVVLPGIGKKEAVEFCQQLRRTLNQTLFFTEEKLNIHLTASFGIATFPEDAQTKAQILHVADKRMYQIKGKNKDGIACS